MSGYTELDVEIARMSDIETKNALKRLIVVISNRITCRDEGGECPISGFCRKSSRPCDIVFLRYAKGDAE